MYKLSKAEKTERSAQRGKYPAGMRWYVVKTYGGDEASISEKIRSTFSSDMVEDVFLPIYHGHSGNGGGQKPTMLFSGYVFLRCNMDDEIYMEICGWPHVLKVLGKAWRIPEPVPDVEIGWLKGLLMASHRPQLVGSIAAGDIVEVSEGLMKGMRGCVIEGNANTVKIQTRFSFLGAATGINFIVPRTALKITIRDLVARANPQETEQKGES